ncbi:MAG: O-antigen ligase family protein [Terracidiphilus sp.]
MRRVTWSLLLLFVFTIPWEYSLDLGAPLGNIARIAGLLLLLVAIPAVLQAGRLRNPGPLLWLLLALYLWFCCTYFWTIDPQATLDRMRAYFQEMMTVWLVWEFAENPRDLRALLRAWLAGAWVLAILTVANFASAQPVASGQIRFAAVGQDPNDVARFLDLGFPIAALLLDWEPRWPGRLLALGYLPLGLAAVLLTASRGGFVAAVAAFTGCGVLLFRNHMRGVVAGLLGLPMVAVALWFAAPHETLGRLTTIAGQVRGGDLNQRLNIWVAGWHAFVQAPFFGHGAGAFVNAAGLSPIDTAHNTALSILVEGGICAFVLAFGLVVMSARSALETRGSLRIALLTLLLVWVISSLVGTLAESRTTWLLLAVIALAARIAREQPERLAFASFTPTGPDGLGAAPAGYPG